MRDKLTKMTTAKWAIFCLLFAITVLSCAIAENWDYGENNDNTHAEKSNSRQESDPNEKCKKEKPECVETGGSCKDEGEDYVCVCPQKFVYIDKLGCKDPNEKCKKEKPQCVETGGSCKDEGEEYVCVCPQKFVYIDKLGCKVREDECNAKVPNCIKTDGLCIISGAGEIECICPRNMFYVEDDGCKIPCNERKKCENGGTCEKNGNKNFCKCNEGTSGHLCEIVDGCENNSTFCGKENISGAKCIYNATERDATCACRITNLKFDENSLLCRKPCDTSNDTCKYGSQCIGSARGKHAFCNCKKGISGNSCENIDDCTKLKCDKKGEASCEYDEISEGAFCKCVDKNKAYDTVNNICFGYDPCILKKINNECKEEHEYCDEGECKCENGYKYSKDKTTCEVDICDSCPTGSQCDLSSDEPCKCKDGYFHENKCVRYGKCDVGFSRCTQLCEKSTGKCKCENGFKLSNDNVTCEIKEDADSCSLDCSPGSCSKKSGTEKCICPHYTHEFVNGSCIDLCTLKNGKPPKSLKCPKGVKCVNDAKHFIRCNCEDPYEQAEDGIHCIRKEMCKEPEVIKECKSKSALCKEVETGKGYECECDKPFKFNADNTTCIRKCDFKKNECLEKNAVCNLNDNYDAECRCPPLLAWEDNKQRCSELAEISYIGDISLLKSNYIIEHHKDNTRHKRSTDPIDSVKLEKDLRETVKHVYGKKNVRSVNIVDCKVSDVIRCEIELQFKKAPDDVDLLISPSYCITLKDNFCMVKDLVIKREKYSDVFERTDPCIVKDTFCDFTTKCNTDDKKATFKCTCEDGYEPIGSFNPVSNEGNIVQICTDIDECHKNIHECQQNTTCKNSLGNYTCECDTGFKRKSPDKDPRLHGCEAVCDPNPCKNDGECVQKRDEGFMCKCKPLYTGLTCNETVAAKAVPVNHKSAAIVGGVLGTLLVIVLIMFVFIYRRSQAIKNDDDEEYAKHRQRSVLAEINRLQSRQRSENADIEIDPNTSNRHTRLQRERDEHTRESSEGRMIPRVQATRNRSSDQGKSDRRSDPEMSRKVSGMPSKGDDRLRNKMHYSNQAYDEEE